MNAETALRNANRSSTILPSHRKQPKENMDGFCAVEVA
jgi:hypothetical protein